MVKIYLYVFYIFIPCLANGHRSYYCTYTIIINTYNKTKNFKSSKTNSIFLTFYIPNNRFINNSNYNKFISMNTL